MRNTGMHGGQEWIGKDPDPKHQKDQRQQRCHFAPVQIGQASCFLRRDSERDPLNHPEEIDGGEYDPKGGDGGDGLAQEKTSHEDEEFADEAICPRQAEG